MHFMWKTQVSPPLSLQVLNDIHAGRYIHGVAVHWYMDSFVPAEISLGVTHHLYPEYYLFGTEACSGWSPLDRGVKLGSWHRAEQYAHDIIEVRSSWLMHESYACSVRSTVSDMWFQGGSPPSMLPCRFTGCSLLHTLFLRNCPQAIRASWNWCFVSSVFTLSLSQRKSDSLHSIHFAWKHSDSWGGICLCRCVVLVTSKQNTRRQSNGFI